MAELEGLISFQKEDNKNLYDSYTQRENEYLEKIKNLENKLLTSEKKDYPSLIKEKKERENQVYILKNQIQNLSFKYAEESKQYKILVGEMIKTIEDINTEIILIRHTKDQLLEYKQDDIQKNKPKNHEKIELVMRYSKIPTKLESNVNNNNVNDITITRGNETMMEYHELNGIIFIRFLYF